MAWIKAFGRTYNSKLEVLERFKELNALNVKHGPSDDRVTEYNALLEEYEKRCAAERYEREYPYYCYWRSFDGQRKGKRRFRTRNAQSKFMWETPHAVTFYN